MYFFCTFLLTTCERDSLDDIMKNYDTLPELPERPDCGNLEDVSRVKDRGFFVIRKAFSENDLTEVQSHLNAISYPNRYLCGASDVQPRECLTILPVIKNFYDQMAKDWIDSDFYNDAMLGLPIRQTGGEFIRLNKWTLPIDKSCAYTALLLDTNCTYENLSNDFFNCAIGTIYKYTMEELKVRIQRIIDNTDCTQIRQIMDNDMLDYSMGGKWFNFPKWGHDRSWSNFKAYLTTALNDSTWYQGYHDWHTDGPHACGRYHKFYVMLNKKSEDYLRGNIKLVPAQYSHNVNKYRKEFLNKKNINRIMGIRDDWSFYEKMSCDIPLANGDAVFFREDVWHRTQGVDVDRDAYISDIIRYPIPNSLNLLPSHRFACTYDSYDTFCALSGVLSQSFIEYLLVFFQKNAQNVSKREGGRVYSDTFVTQSLLQQVFEKLSPLIPFLNRFQFVNFQFVSIDPILAYKENDPGSGDWHVDGLIDGFRPGHKLWIPLSKSDRNHSNIEFRPSQIVTTLPGDVIYFNGKIEHRTQNFYVRRTAIIIVMRDK